MNRSSRRAFFLAISFLACLREREERAEIPDARSFDSRFPISIERRDIFSSIGILEVSFRDARPPRPEEAIAMNADEAGDRIQGLADLNLISDLLHR